MKNPSNLQATCSIQTSLVILCRKSKYRLECLLVWKIYDRKLSLIVFSVNGGDLQPCCFSKVHYERTTCCSPIDVVFENDYWFQITETVHWVVLGLSQTGVCLHRCVWIPQWEKLKGRPIEWYAFNPPLFLLVNTFNFLYFPEYELFSWGLCTDCAVGCSDFDFFSHFEV